MYFYKDENSVWRVGNSLKSRLSTNGVYELIAHSNGAYSIIERSGGSYIFQKLLPTQIKKNVAGNFYADDAELLAVLDDFFVDAQSGAGLTTEQQALIATIPDKINRSEISEISGINTKIINSDNDLPTPTDTGDGLGVGYRITEAMYRFTSLSLIHPIIPSNVGSTYAQHYIDGANIQTVLYGGTGALFRANATSAPSSLKIANLLVYGDGTNDAFDYVAPNSFDIILDNAYFNGFDKAVMKPSTYLNIRFTSFDNIASGLDIGNSTGMTINSATFQDVAPFGKSQINISGSFLAVKIINTAFIPVAGDYAIYIDPAITGKVLINGATLIGAYGGLGFDPAGLDHTDPRVMVINCDGFENSATFASIAYSNNSTITDIVTINQWIPIAGTTYPVYLERATMSANGEITFTNLESKDVMFRFSFDAQALATNDFQIRFLKNGNPIQVNGADFIRQYKGVTGGNGVLLGEVATEAVAGDVFLLQIRNIEGTNDITIKNGTITIA